MESNPGPGVVEQTVHSTHSTSGGAGKHTTAGWHVEVRLAWTQLKNQT